MPSARQLAALLAVLLLAAALGGCGEDESETVAESGTVAAKVLEEVEQGIPAQVGQWMIQVETDPGGEPAYTVEQIVTPSGNANFHLVNPQSVGHDLTIEEVGGGSAGTRVVQKGSAWRRMSLFEGERYVFYCSVPGHRKAGMEGRIRVDPRLEADDLEPY